MTEKIKLNFLKRRLKEMVIFTIMDYSKTLRKLIQTKGYKIKVNENSFLVFESKEHYKKIKRLEKKTF